MPAGRPRKPTQMHIAEGTFRADRALPEEMMPRKLSFAPSPPELLSTRAKRLWHSVCAELAELEMLFRVDIEIVAQYCVETDSYWTAVEMLQKYGATQVMYTKTGDSYEIPSPWIKIKDSHFKNSNQIAIQLGFTPVGRTRIAAQPIEREGTFESMMGMDDEEDF